MVGIDEVTRRTGVSTETVSVVPHVNRWFFSSVVQGAEPAPLRNGYGLTL